MILDGLDRHCRYLSAPGADLGYYFGNFLKKLKISLDRDQLCEMVRYGWIQPILRVRLPDRFYFDWKDYPVLSFHGSFSEEDRWAIRLFSRAATNASVSQPNWAGNWYTHYLDNPDNELTQQVLAHVIPAGPGMEEPAPLQHPRGKRIIYPWIDFFGYWQVYEILEALHCARIVGPLFNEPDVEKTIESVRTRLPELREWSDFWLKSTREHWEQNRPVFDWVSRFRTLLGIWLHFHQDWAKVREAAPRLLEDLQLTPEDLKTGIRDVLLVQWQRWNPSSKQEEDSSIPRSVRAHLQEDIQRAVEFLEQATGHPLDYDDPFGGTS